MRCDNISSHTFSYSWAAHDQCDIDFLFKAAFLAGLKTVLTNVVAIVGGVEDISVP